MNIKKTKILVCDSYSRNTGDVAILISLIKQIKEKFINPEIVIESSHPKHLIETYLNEFNGILIVPRIIDIQEIDGNSSGKLNKIKRYFLGFYDYLCFFVWALFNHFYLNPSFLIRKKRREQALVLLGLDYAISTGGGFISTYYNYQLRLGLYILLLLLNKPLFICAQSIGPFDTKISKILIPYVLKKSGLITVRELWSFNYLSNFGIHSQLTADLAFLLPMDEKKSIEKKNVSICIKNDGNNLRDNKYIKIIVELSKYLISKEYSINIVSQTPNDDDMGEKIIKESGSDLVKLIKYGVNPKKLKSIYSLDDFIISSRMHALIFCCEQFVPFIALSYEPKFDGFFTSLNYDSTMIFKDSELDTDFLKKSIDSLISKRNDLSEHLAMTIPKIKKDSERNIDLIVNYEI